MADKNQVAKRKNNVSPENREKLSRLARERHEKGLLGGPEFGKLGGRPRKDRVTKKISEAAQEEGNTRAIIQVFKDAVDPRQQMQTRLKGAELWAKIDAEEAKISIQEEQARDKQLSRDEMLEILKEKLTSGPAAQLLRRQLEEETGIVDAEVVEEDED